MILGRIAVVATTVLCAVALGISIYPGWLNDLLSVGVVLGFLASPVILIVAAAIATMVHRRGELRLECIPWSHVRWVLTILLLTYVSLRFYIPRRIAFAWSRPSFEQLVSHSREGEVNRQFNRRLGPYFVDEYAVDNRGGTYFRVYSGADGIGPDVTSYGFCYHPNDDGTPFGAAHYRTFRMGHGWYWFRASDDWY